jgi:hypothetical protein
MSDTQENAPKGNPNGSGEPNGDRRRRSRGGRNRNRNRNNKPKEEGQENAKPVEAQSSEEAKPPKEGDSRNRNQRNKNNRRPEGKEVKAAPVSEELQEQLEAQNELYNLEFEKDGPAIWEETIHVKPVIGITCGDLNGIGMEIIMKTLENTELTDLCTPVVFGSSKFASYNRNAGGMNSISVFAIASMIFTRARIT